MTATSSDSTEVRIRAAERADLLAIYRIEKVSFASPWPFEAFERYLSEPGFLVAVDGEESSGSRGRTADSGIDTATVAGYIVADIVPNHGRPLGHVKDLAVHPDRRGRGIGTSLLEAGLRRLYEESVSSVKLEVREDNEGAQRLYSGFGFRPLRRLPRYYDDGEDAIIMVLTLGQ